ncbi:MAG: extracellular solute-binding protein, partial [Hyphomicrobiaceae bacterium]
MAQRAHMMSLHRPLIRLALWLALALAPFAGVAEPRHGIAMHDEPQLGPDFRHFPYVAPAAPKGGRLRLGAFGTFDSLNPFVVMGVAAQGVREYVYESLLARSADEPFTLYGLIAGHIDVPDDRSWIVFHLRPEARFSDGTPITTDDILFSHAALRDMGLPNLRTYYSKVVRAEAVAPHSVRFTFEAGGDREIPLILGLMPILPRRRHPPAAFERTTLEPPVGSGPYVVAAVDAGRSILYRRDPNHWAKDLPVYRGRFNFDEIRFDYFRDASALFEAFKSGQIDARGEDDPGRWSQEYAGPALDNGRLLKKEFEIGTPAGLSALVFNTRRVAFSDPRVRQALILLFDFEWINRSLYHGAYRRTDSVFARSVLAAAGRPADARERALLAPFMKDVLPDSLEGRFRLPVGDGSGTDRENMRRAFALLTEAGYRLQGSTLVAAQTGKPLAFEFLVLNRAQERLVLAFAANLEKIGIRTDIRQVDSQQYWKRVRTFDFDMIQF